MNLTDAYWEVYDDQDESDFNYLSYIDRTGKEVIEKINNLDKQVYEIRRVNGRVTQIKVYKVEEFACR